MWLTEQIKVCSTVSPCSEEQSGQGNPLYNTQKMLSFDLLHNTDAKWKQYSDDIDLQNVFQTFS